MANDLNHVKERLYELFNDASEQALHGEYNWDPKIRQQYLDQATQAVDKIIDVEKALEDTCSRESDEDMKTEPEKTIRQIIQERKLNR